MTEYKKKYVSEQLNTQQHNRVCKVIRWHIYKIFDIPIPENLRENEPKAITKNIEEIIILKHAVGQVITHLHDDINHREDTYVLTYDLMIPSCVNIENKALQPDIILRYKKREEGIAN